MNRLTRAVEERKARGLPILDLTETNPRGSASRGCVSLGPFFRCQD
jgi:hypothetical protein